MKVTLNYFDDKSSESISTDPMHFVVFDSDCRSCDENRRIVDCRKKSGVCSFNGRCYKDGSKKPDEACSVCKHGIWVNEKRKELF